MTKISESLIQECKKQKRTAMAELYTILAPSIKTTCYRYVANVEDAEDLMQESFIQIFSNISKYKIERNFEGWCHRIAINLCLKSIRKNKNKFFTSELEHLTNEIDESNDDLESIHLSAAMALEELSKLPTGYRLVFNMYAIDEMSHKEIAEQLGISEGTSRSQYSRAKQQLQQILQLEKQKQNDRV